MRGARTNLSERIQRKIEEMGGEAAVRRKMGVTFPSGTSTDSRLMINLNDKKRKSHDV
jgi:hypothetical protein